MASRMTKDQRTSARPAPARRPGEGRPAPAGDRRRGRAAPARTRTIAELSVEDIAAEAGISRSGFYFYFESKYAALARRAERRRRRHDRRGRRLLRRQRARAARLRRRARSAGSRDCGAAHADLMVAVVDAAHSDRGARALWDDWRERFVDVDRPQHRGRSAPRAARPANGVATEDLARALLAMNLGTSTTSRARAPPTTRPSGRSPPWRWCGSSAVWGEHPTR